MTKNDDEERRTRKKNKKNKSKNKTKNKKERCMERARGHGASPAIRFGCLAFLQRCASATHQGVLPMARARGHGASSGKPWIELDVDQDGPPACAPQQHQTTHDQQKRAKCTALAGPRSSIMAVEESKMRTRRRRPPVTGTHPPSRPWQRVGCGRRISVWKNGPIYFWSSPTTEQTRKRRRGTEHKTTEPLLLS